MDNKIKHKGDFEINKELHKDPSMRIVPYALYKYYIDGIDIKETIRNHKNIYDFCIRLKIKSGSKGQYRCIKNGEYVDTPLSKTTRYFVSNKGGILLKQTSKVKSGVTVGFNVTLFNKYVDLPDYDINYNFYIAECQKIIQAVDNGQLELSLWDN